MNDAEHQSMFDLPSIAGIRAFEGEIPNDSTSPSVWRTALRDWAATLRDDGRMFGRGEAALGKWGAYWLSTSHNPVRLAFEHGVQQTHLDYFPSEPRIPGVVVDLWLFDFDNLDELMDDVEDSPLWQ